MDGLNSRCPSSPCNHDPRVSQSSRFPNVLVLTDILINVNVNFDSINYFFFLKMKSPTEELQDLSVLLQSFYIYSPATASLSYWHSWKHLSFINIRI